MTDMIERVARAIWADEYDAASWEEASEKDRMTRLGWARAAIEAMREPTAAMVETGDLSGTESLMHTDDGGGGGGVTWMPNGASIGIWRTMIDAALSEKGEG